MMPIEIEKFSSVLQTALKNGLVCFEDCDVELDFEPIVVYRKLRKSAIQEDDFKSQAELMGEGKLDKWPNVGGENCIGNYSCSFFSNFSQLKSCFSSKRNYSFAKGNLMPVHGVIRRGEKTHIDCWVYQDSNIKECFEVYNEG